MAERVVLHSDLNAFYCSVELMLKPSLRGLPVAVSGSTEDRHGIVLAKSPEAKACGIKTGMVNWEARRNCPDIIFLPPQYDQYLKYSKLVREIYQRYTDLVEPFGMDECWLDVTGSRKLFGSGEQIATSILRTVREELGLTVSIGVSFNKIFAKLGSDMSSPDSLTVIGAEDFREKIWGMPCSRLIFVGRATEKKLSGYGIHTIGELAAADPDFLQRALGKCGPELWRSANGLDDSPVAHKDFLSPIKSIGHGVTAVADLENRDEVWVVLLDLSQDVAHRLRLHGLSAQAVQLTVRQSELTFRQYQGKLENATQSPMEIACAARRLFNENYRWSSPVRALTVRAIDLAPDSDPRQMNFLIDNAKHERLEKLDETVDALRSRFGRRSLLPAALLCRNKMPGKNGGGATNK